MLPMNQIPMLSQDDYNDYLEFQNFKKLKQQYNKPAGIPQGLNLSANSSAAAAAFNFFNSASANGGNSPLNNSNSIFPITTSSASVPPSLLNQTFFNQQQQPHQQQLQSTQIIPKVVPNGMPLTLMRQPPAASFMQPYKTVANFPGLKGGASNYARPSPAMYPLPPALAIQSLTPQVATSNTAQQSITPPLQHHYQTQIYPTASTPPKRRPVSPEIIVDDRPDIPAKKTKAADKSFAEFYTAKNESFLPNFSSAERRVPSSRLTINDQPQFRLNRRIMGNSSDAKIRAATLNFFNNVDASLRHPSTSAAGATLHPQLKTHNGSYSIPKQTSSFLPDMNSVGIDFGTTECCAAVIRKNGPDFVVLDSVTSKRTMPSYVAFDEEHPKCGQIVVDRMRHKSDYSVYDVKRILGRDYKKIAMDPIWPFKIRKGTLSIDNKAMVEVGTFNGRERKSAEEIAAVLLQHIKTVTETYQNTKLTEAVIAIPSEFSEELKEAFQMAAELAGWKTIHFIPEPVAAAFAYFAEVNIPNGANVLFCDIGGGTMDACVAKIENDELQILSFYGDSYLGGRDFDNILITHFRGILKHKFGIDVFNTQKKYILKQKCQDIKHILSACNEAWLDVQDFDSSIEEEIIKVTKSEFEEMSLPLIVRMKDVIIRTLTKAVVSETAIDYVFQVGGGCRMPLVEKFLTDLFPDSHHQCRLYPDWAVAHGAALYGYYLQSNMEENVVPH